MTGGELAEGEPDIGVTKAILAGETPGCQAEIVYAKLIVIFCLAEMIPGSDPLGSELQELHLHLSVQNILILVKSRIPD